MGIFGRKKAAAAPAAADPLAELSVTLGRLAHAVEAMDAGVPLLLEQLAQQLSAVGSVMNDPFLSAVRRGQGVELLTRALQDACQDEPQALEALIEIEALGAARVAYQSAALSCIASVAYIGGVAEVQQHSDLPLLAALIANRDETVRAYAAACLQNVTSLVEQVDLEAVAPLLPLLEAMLVDHADEESVSGPAQLLLSNVERAARLNAGDASALIEEASAPSEEASEAAGKAAPGEKWRVAAAAAVGGGGGGGGSRVAAAGSSWWKKAGAYAQDEARRRES